MRRRSSFSRNSIVFVCVLVTVSSLCVIIVSILRLPDIISSTPIRPRKFNVVSNDDGIGKFGEMMVEMLPEDVAFTIFMPSEKAFERDLRLNLNESLVVGEKLNDTFALLSRILGFSVVPRMIVSDSVCYGKEISYDSLSGFGLFVSKDLDGMLVVNRVGSERVDVRKGKFVLHIMDGVIMEADFEQSVRQQVFLH